ncbi:hypothetical protein HanXRQr2_Chr06g0241391 [Helianthus annuus]|uniref:Uncharacterized protein n=1 Tax=Helianthus annuus TaxID=4232 RepID=A0A9K3IQ28_HELAN|nr:hypothetical protein HanXRQr2_Chr06g0241391 [Helianthus annuus]KAJ0559225.1 hypothetical protein HanHA300_Chr06g0197981 [Helianthus annuus]KAJ0572164.1 hypothetical protein HanHA89_Chr06g0212771 [Helianthus annuus]KAJ0736631.1 hypothetical protein HanLR1_Chr06g0198051 [Helianthus annuus]KAJ0739567.1 hypothetical protein HanOQP8_Chr06g0207191 [Helianthus annuus]
MVLVVLILEPPGRNRPGPESIFHINLEPGTDPYIQKGSGPRFSRVGFKVLVGRNRETLTPSL